MPKGDPFITSIEDAVALVKPGDRLVIAGSRLTTKPMALVRELIRQGTCDLEVMGNNVSIDADMLVGNGQARQLTFTFCGLDIAGNAPHFRKKIESGEVKALEFGTMAMLRSLEAAERDIPFGYARSMIGSDLLKQHPGKHRKVGDQLLLEVPAYQPDVAFVHAPFADVNGNVLLAHETFNFIFAKSAKKCVVSVDRILPSGEFRVRGPSHVGVVELKARDIDALVVLPWGAYPTSCFPLYTQDLRHVLEYADLVAEKGLDAYLDRYVRGRTEAAFLEIVGLARLVKLQKMMDFGRAAVSRD